LQYFEYFVKNFGKFLPKDKKAAILDIGVGNGRTLRTLKKLKYENAFGVDIAQDLIKKAKREGLNCQWVGDTIGFLKTNKQKFSVIHISHVVEHIPKEELVDLMKAIKGALVEDGFLVGATPSVQNIFYLGPFFDFTHVNFFTERSLSQICEMGEFSSINIVAEKNPINKYGKGYLNFIRFLFSDLLIRIARKVINSSIYLIRFSIGTINPKILSFNLIFICKK
jgi:predicted TPR repeat methyltransferase